MVLIFTHESARGMVTAGSRRYVFEVFAAKNSEISETVKVEWRLKILLGDSLEKFLKNNKFNDIFDFHEKFSEFVKEKLSNVEQTPEWLQNPQQTCEFIKILKDEIEVAGNFIKDFDIEKGTVTIEITDSQLRIHKAHLKLSQHYQVEPIQVVSHDLPLQRINSTESSFSHILSISEFCQKFLELVTHFQEFWNRMSVLDSQCDVLDPAAPTFKDVCRRIKLTDTLSVVLTFNPFFPKEKPQIKLLGCYLDVNHYEDILQNNLEKDIWDPEEDLLYNLSNILEINIPGKMIVEDSNEANLSGINESASGKGDCAICFCWRVGDELPTEVCENAACRSMYHSTCLFKYLSSLSRNRNYFCKIQGECPNCDDAITCSVPNFM